MTKATSDNNRLNRIHTHTHTYTHQPNCFVFFRVFAINLMFNVFNALIYVVKALWILSALDTLLQIITLHIGYRRLGKAWNNEHWWIKSIHSFIHPFVGWLVFFLRIQYISIWISNAFIVHDASCSVWVHKKCFWPSCNIEIYKCAIHWAPNIHL